MKKENTMAGKPYLKLYFEDWEYEENPELRRVTERLVQLFTQALK